MDEPNSRIIYPQVPPREEDPAARRNVMRKVFNANLPPRDRPRALEEGFYYEIETAFELIGPYAKITHGKQISRPLTAEEKAAGKKGDSQMVLVPMGGKSFRELDMVYTDKNGLVHIVETKYTRSPDHHQLKPNVELARKIGGKLVYTVGQNKQSQGKAIEEAYKNIPEARHLAPIEIIYLQEHHYSQRYNRGDTGKLGAIPTREDHIKWQNVKAFGTKYDDAEMDRLETMLDPALG